MRFILLLLTTTLVVLPTAFAQSDSPLKVQAIEFTYAHKPQTDSPAAKPQTDNKSTSTQEKQTILISEKDLAAPENKIINLKPGTTVEVKLKLQLDHGYHAYLDQYKFELLGPKEFYLSEFQIKPLVKFTDPVSKKIKMGTEGYAEMVSLLDVPKDLMGGTHQLQFMLTYQACGVGFCLFPQKIPLDAQVKIESLKEDHLTRALEKGWIYALFFVFIAGILTSFTPCIFPMIPITLAILGTHGHVRSRLLGFSISLTYVLGIAITYALLGVAAAKTGALFGSLLGHPLVIGAIAVLFVLMGLSMYGLFEIQMPAFITHRLARNSTGKNFIGAFISGLIAGVVASPCVGPVLISVLAFVAQTQNTTAGFILLFTFALGLGQLFLFIGTFQGLIHKLPKSGPWMEQVKFIFGTVMIGMALYYVYPVTHGALFDGLIATTLIAISIFFGAFKPRHHLKKTARKLQRSAMLVLFVFGVLFAVKSLVPQHVQDKLLQNSPATSEQNKIAAPDWMTYSAASLQKAAQDGLPVIIDFRADWCLACKELELYTFSNPKILDLGKNFIWLTFDATSPSDQLTALQKQYNIGGLPFVLFYDKHGKELKNLTLHGFEKPDKFLLRMQEAMK